MGQTRPNPASVQAFCQYFSPLIHFNSPILGQFQPIHPYAICPPISFKGKLSLDLSGFALVRLSIGTVYAYHPSYLSAAGVHFTNFGVACRCPWTGIGSDKLRPGRVGRVSHYTISKFIFRRSACYSRGLSTCMTESKRRANIEKVQARQNRYKAMGRCWCGREVRLGYKMVYLNSYIL